MRIYTVGHSNMSAQELVELLKRYSIQVVVDVRSVPYSRHNPRFDRETLERTLVGAGIEYHYGGGHLGGRPRDRTVYVDGKLRYALVRARPWYEEGLRQLLEIAGQSRTAILCSEENPWRCHRQRLIGQDLLAQGVAVHHIRRKGGLEQAHV